MKTTHINRRSIHKMLALRLSIAGAIIALLISVSVLINERRQVSEAVLEYAVQGALNFNIHAAELLEKSPDFDRLKMKGALDDFILERAKIKRGYSNGYFVLVRVLDTEGDMLAEIRDDDYPHMEAVRTYVAVSSRSLYGGEEGIHETIRIDGVLHLNVLVPLRSIKGEVVAHVKGVFALSDQAKAKAMRRVLRSIFYVIGIVFVTAVLLYPVILSLLRRLTALTYDLLDSHMETLKVLGSAIAKRDSDTDIHNYRVTISSVRIAESLGMDDEVIRSLIKGAFLHDMGKIGIPDNVLLKPGRLTRGEFKIMKTHVNAGLDIVNRSEWLNDATAVVASHHEKLDGSGYPNGLKGKENPITARVFAIADVFDALTSRRPYKEPLSFDETMDILEEGKGTHFDPDILDSFSKIARSLYDHFTARTEEEIKMDLETIIQHYF